MSNPFQPKDIDEAIHKVNNNTSTCDDHAYLEKEMGLNKYMRSRVHKLVGETRVYLNEFDENKKFVREVEKWVFFNAGQARAMEKDMKRLIPPGTTGNEKRYIKIGYTHNTSEIRNGEKRYIPDKKPGKGEMYPYDKFEELFELGESIKDNYKDIRGVNPK